MSRGAETQRAPAAWSVVALSIAPAPQPAGDLLRRMPHASLRTHRTDPLSFRRETHVTDGAVF
jgi:hypothetical protein